MAKKVAAPPTLEKAMEQLKVAERQLMIVRKNLQTFIDDQASNRTTKVLMEDLAQLAAKAAGYALAASTTMKRWANQPPKPASAPVPAENPAVTPPRDALNTQEQHVVVFGAAIQTTGLLHSVVQPTQTEVPTTPLAEPPIDGSDTPPVPMTPVPPWPDSVRID